MAYLRIKEDASLSGLGCGPGCKCGPCRRSQFSGFGERYIRDEDFFRSLAPPEPLPPPEPPKPQGPQPMPGAFPPGYAPMPFPVGPPQPEWVSGWGFAGLARGSRRLPRPARPANVKVSQTTSPVVVTPGTVNVAVQPPAPPAPGSAAPASGPAPGAVFRFECPAGCHQGAEAACRRVLFRALADAIGLCSEAASQLEASPPSTRTRNIFRSLFGHDPSRPVPWAGGRASGAIVAHRLRKVAEAFHGRVTHFRCGGFPGAPAGQQCGPNVNAFTLPLTHPNLIFLCPPFWNQEPLVPATPPFPGTPEGRARVARFWRAGIVLHEMLHLVYRGFFRHFAVPPNPDDPQERRRDNAHCYEAFALQVNRHLASPHDVTACEERPA